VLELVAVLQEDTTRSLARDGLTAARAHLLWELQHRGPTPQRALADALRVSARNITGLVDGLVVRRERMLENIGRGLGLHASSRVLGLLVERGGMSREAAYAVVQRAALRAADERSPLRDLLAVDAEVAKRISLTDLDACFDDAAFLRHVPAVIARLDSLEAQLDAAR